MSRRFQILITDDSLPLGGKETLLLQHLAYLDRAVFEVHLVTLTDKGELLPEAREKADHYACLGRRWGLDVGAVWQLRRYLVRRKIDLVHTSQWLDSLYVWLAAKGLPVRKVAMVHGYDRTWRRDIYLKVLKSFDRIFSVSQAHKLDLYKDGLPWEKIKVIRNTYDANRFTMKTSRTNNKNDAPFRIVMVGRFDWIKDQATLIQAVNLLKNRGYNIKLHLVGQGEDKYYAMCRALVTKLNLHEVVRFWGGKRVNGEFLADYDLFVFSSFCDTFGIALLEAMACGLPVLVSDISPSMEIIQHGRCGCYFQTGNAESCAAAIAKLIQDPELRHSLGQKSYRRAHDFQPTTSTRNLQQAYLEIITRQSI
jgi:glycosyltransferase involved in cell wall biosynthesis